MNYTLLTTVRIRLREKNVDKSTVDDRTKRKTKSVNKNDKTESKPFLFTNLTRGLRCPELEWDTDHSLDTHGSEVRPWNNKTRRDVHWQTLSYITLYFVNGDIINNELVISFQVYVKVRKTFKEDWEGNLLT